MVKFHQTKIPNFFEQNLKNSALSPGVGKYDITKMAPKIHGSYRYESSKCAFLDEA